ncbi:MAG: ribonuclease P protein component [Planctomycetota bacterium]|nr:ribonuclease P protein component [Planctomycetota bacterium]
MADDPTPSPVDHLKSYGFPRSLRLTEKTLFLEVYDRRRKVHAGPLVVYGKPNGGPHPRLGMSIGRKVGGAVRRNRIRRLVRESFRLMQHDLPKGYDFVINVRPHEPFELAEYQRLLARAARQLHQSWTRKPEPDNTNPPVPLD